MGFEPSTRRRTLASPLEVTLLLRPVAIYAGFSLSSGAKTGELIARAVVA
jgi:hypothetical protein